MKNNSLHGQKISYSRPDGKHCDGFYVQPASGDQAPGLVVIQEWWGLNDQIRGVANRLRAAGYRALVPDLYRGELGLDAKEAEHLMSNLNFGDAAAQDIRGAVQHLKRSSAKVGIIGFCMGGALTILAAVHVPEADAAVGWYGFPPLDYIDASRIHAPLMGHFAISDAYFPISQVDTLEEMLKAAKVKYEFHRYHAQHAFAHEAGANYDSASAETAWKRTLAFLSQHLA